MLTTTSIAAALLALAPISAAQNLQPDQQQNGEGLVPFGEFSGAWVSASMTSSGVLSGVLTDALGRPLWILDAELNEQGSLEGNLVPLEYASNPASGLTQLAVLGATQVDASGAGSFSAVIYEAITGPMHTTQGSSKPHILVLGQVSGQLQNGRLVKPNHPGFSSQSQGSTGAAGHQVDGPLLDPKGPDHAVDTVAQAGAGSQAAGNSQAGSGVTPDGGDAQGPGHQVPGSIIQCPKGPSISMQGASAAPAMAAAGSQTGGSIQDPKGPDHAIQSVQSAAASAGAQTQPQSATGSASEQGGVDAAGHQTLPSSAGKAVGRWSLDT